jgi:hypothetical protein
VEQERPTPPVFSEVRVARSLVFCVMLFTSLSVFLLATALCVPLRFTASDYPFGNIIFDYICSICDGIL